MSFPFIFFTLLYFGALICCLVAACSCKNKRARINGAVLAFLMTGLSFPVAVLVSKLSHNIEYSQAARNLLNSSVETINAGDAERVSKELAVMSDELKVTYESLGNFKELAIEATERLNSVNGVTNIVKEEENGE
ncbi:hypothetical protein OAB00_02840 [Akkermansiaceae bacterium]|nr:hypothetical protein [Akkermansiaceae bacterium]